MSKRNRDRKDDGGCIYCGSKRCDGYYESKHSWPTGPAWSWPRWPGWVPELGDGSKRES